MWRPGDNRQRSGRFLAGGVNCDGIAGTRAGNELL
jgi:hypothetical protein